MKSLKGELMLLLHLIDEGYDKRAWHGTNLRGSLRGLTSGQALWRPSPNRHNIWEIAVHAAYWKYAVRRRLLGEKRGSFPLKGSNWFARTSGGEAAWKQDLKLLDGMHRTMRNVIAGLRLKQLYATSRGSKYRNVTTICGIAAHDIYHAGQIQLLKRLQKR